MSSELTAAERAEIEAWADWHENHPPHTLDSDVAAQYVRRLLDTARAGEGLREALRDIRNIAASLGGPLPDIYRLEIFAIADRTLAALHPDTAAEKER